MPCPHRFLDELLPKHPVDFLFIGTFNPKWDVLRGDNPDYFYSRSKNEFWCILPHAMNQNCLVDKARKKKEQFCVKNKIGLTDLILQIENVNEKDSKHNYLKKGFKDEDFEGLGEEGQPNLKISFHTKQIIKYISKNKLSLKGVFLTRKTSKGIPRIWNEWLQIKNHCTTINITAKELASPSPRGGGIRDKIFDWRKELNSLKSKQIKC